MIKAILLTSLIYYLGYGEKIYTGIEDLIHYYSIKSNNNLTDDDLLKAKKRHLLRFPKSPFKDSFGLLIYDKKAKSVYSKIKFKKIRKKKSKDELISLYVQSVGVQAKFFTKYVDEKSFQVDELDFLESLLFINVFIHGKKETLIKPFKEYIRLYKEKKGRNWHIRYWKDLKKASKGDIEIFAWYTYKASEFFTANYVYSKAIRYQPDPTHWFYLGLTSFRLSKYEEAKEALKIFLNSECPPHLYKNLKHTAHYYYYYSFDKLRRGQDILKEMHQYCKKHPGARMYRLLLRMAKRNKYKHHKAIQRDFLKLFPNSYTAYLQNREKAFDLLTEKRKSGKKFLKKAYGGHRQKEYEEILLWLFVKNKKKKENYFSKGGNWFLDYFYQEKPDGELWGKWISNAESHLGKLDNNFIKKHKVFYLTDEEKKWRWFQGTDKGFASNINIRYWKRYTNRINAFVRFGNEQLIEREIKKFFPSQDIQKLLYLKALYSYSSNIYKQASLYGLLINSYRDLKGAIPHAVYKHAYPLHRYEKVKLLSERHKIPIELFYGIMRAESFYKENAVSSAGAIGLMQIMPSTGEWVYRKTTLSKKYKYDLFSPELNLEIAAQFLGDLYKRFRGNVILTAAAYNAGGGAVGKWIRNKKVKDWVQFSYFIPYNQTERYVRKVIENMQVYRNLYSVLTDVEAKKNSHF